MTSYYISQVFQAKAIKLGDIMWSLFYKALKLVHTNLNYRLIGTITAIICLSDYHTFYVCPFDYTAFAVSGKVGIP